MKKLNNNQLARIEMKENQMSFDVGGIDKIDIQREDGYEWKSNEQRKQAGFMPQWVENQAARRDILEKHPDYQFITLVAGHMGTTSETLFVEDDLEAAARRDQFLRESQTNKINSISVDIETIRVLMSEVEKKNIELNETLETIKKNITDVEKIDKSLGTIIRKLNGVNIESLEAYYNDIVIEKYREKLNQTVTQTNENYLSFTEDDDLGPLKKGIHEFLSTHHRGSLSKMIYDQMNSIYSLYYNDNFPVDITEQRRVIEDLYQKHRENYEKLKQQLENEKKRLEIDIKGEIENYISYFVNNGFLDQQLLVEYNATKNDRNVVPYIDLFDAINDMETENPRTDRFNEIYNEVDTYLTSKHLPLIPIAPTEPVEAGFILLTIRVEKTYLNMKLEETKGKIKTYNERLEDLQRRLDDLTLEKNITTIGDVEYPPKNTRRWVENPENSGKVRLNPQVFSAIQDAKTFIDLYCSNLKNIEMDTLQHDKVIRSDFARLVAIIVVKAITRSQRQYTPLQFYHFQTKDEVNVKLRLQRQYELRNSAEKGQTVSFRVKRERFD